MKLDALLGSRQNLSIAPGSHSSPLVVAAADFTAMMWLFAKGSPAKIHRKLETAFAGLGSIREQKDYDLMHADFCGWFTQNIERAQKKKQRESGAAIRKSSYGQAAKVIDIAAKVYVYYCALPSRESAQVLIPLLHGALDNKIVKHLIQKFPETRIKSKQLKISIAPNTNSFSPLWAGRSAKISIQKFFQSSTMTFCSVV